MIHSFPSETAMLDVKEWGRAGEGNKNEPARPATSVNALRTKRLITPRIKGLKVTLPLPVRVVKQGRAGETRRLNRRAPSMEVRLETTTYKPTVNGNGNGSMPHPPDKGDRCDETGARRMNKRGPTRPLPTCYLPINIRLINPTVKTLHGVLFGRASKIGSPVGPAFRRSPAETPSKNLTGCFKSLSIPVHGCWRTNQE